VAVHLYTNASPSKTVSCQNTQQVNQIQRCVFTIKFWISGSTKMWIYNVSENSKEQSWLLKQTISDGHCVLEWELGSQSFIRHGVCV